MSRLLSVADLPRELTQALRRHDQISEGDAVGSRQRLLEDLGQLSRHIRREPEQVPDWIATLLDRVKEDDQLDPAEEVRLLLEQLQFLPPPTVDRDRVEDLIIAIHGVGDQTRYATIQTVANQFIKRFTKPQVWPLGKFHGRISSVTGALVDPDVENPESGQFGFAEVYWADIPRRLAEEGKILEDPVTWARSLTERLLLEVEPSTDQTNPDRKSRDRDYRAFAGVIRQLVEGVLTLQKILKLTSSWTPVKVNVNRLLVDFVNDVQLVTEFETQREQLLDGFDRILATASSFYPRARIHLIAHSEGSVVAFLGLLRAIGRQEVWVRHVATLMTIGCPLDKHLMIWPEVFEAIDPPAQPSPRPGAPADSDVSASPRITWLNYYDEGDPIANDLSHVRLWLHEKRDNCQRWSDFFDQDPANDCRYTRCLFPGEAHNSYWTDDAVFDHSWFKGIRRATSGPEPLDQPGDSPSGTLSTSGATSEPPAPASSDPLAMTTDKQVDPPATSLPIKLVSYTLPYLLATAVLVLGVTVIQQNVQDTLFPMAAFLANPFQTGLTVLVYSSLLAGLTIVIRVPSLILPEKTRRLGRSWISGFLIFAGLAVFCFAGVFGGLALFQATSVIGPRESQLFLDSVDVFGKPVSRLVATLLQEDPGQPIGSEHPFGLAISLGLLWAMALLLGVIGAQIAILLPQFSRQWPWILAVIAVLVGSQAREQFLPGDINHDVQELLARRVATLKGISQEPYPPDGQTSALGIRFDGQILIHQASSQSDPKLDEARPDQPRSTEQIQTDLTLLARLKTLEQVAVPRPLWPILLSVAIFLALWKLAVILFDLTYVWHSFLRSSRVNQSLNETLYAHKVNRVIAKYNRMRALRS